MDRARAHASDLNSRRSTARLGHGTSGAGLGDPRPDLSAAQVIAEHVKGKPKLALGPKDTGALESAKVPAILGIQVQVRSSATSRVSAGLDLRTRPARELRGQLARRLPDRRGAARRGTQYHSQGPPGLELRVGTEPTAMEIPALVDPNDPGVKSPNRCRAGDRSGTKRQTTVRKKRYPLEQQREQRASRELYPSGALPQPCIPRLSAAKVLTSCSAASCPTRCRSAST